MHFTLPVYLFLPVMLLMTGVAHSQGASSSHPNRQATPLPDFDAEPGDKPFALPPVEDGESPAAQPLGQKVVLQRIDLHGNTVFAPATLAELTRPYLERPIDVAELETLRFDLTQFYIRHGYVNSGAIIPAQSIKDGVLRIDIVEGRLDDINIEGEGWLHPGYIRSRLRIDGPFNVNTLQDKFILLLNDPLIKNLNARYKPLPRPGGSALDLKVTRARPYQVALHYNNYNPPSIGAEQIQVDAWVRNLTRWGDKLDFRFETGEGADSFSGGFAIPLTPQGTMFDFHFDVGRSSVIEQPLANIDIVSKIQNFSWTLSHPFIRDPQQNLTLGVSFASRRNETSLLGRNFSFLQGLDSGRSKATVLRLFQEYITRLEDHVLAFRSTFNVGLDTFDATIQQDPALPDSEFFSWLGQLQYAYRLTDGGAQIRLRSTAQFSDQTLLPQERMAIGGRYIVRGYRENQLVRDNGYSGSIELHYPLFSSKGHFANTLTVIPFMDYGLGFNDRGETDELHSVGIGLSWQAFNHVQAEIFYAHDLISASPQSDHNLQDDGVHFNVSVFAF